MRDELVSLVPPVAELDGHMDSALRLPGVDLATAEAGASAALRPSAS
jgi:hypothetical protein